MIDINEVLRRAFEAGKMPPKPDADPIACVTAIGRDGSVTYTQVDLRRRPDGVWEMPE